MMNNFSVKAVGSQLVRLVLKRTANYKKTVLKPQLPFAQLVEKISRKTSFEHTLIDAKTLQIHHFNNNK